MHNLVRFYDFGPFSFRAWDGWLGCFGFAKGNDFRLRFGMEGGGGESDEDWGHNKM